MKLGKLTISGPLSGASLTTRFAVLSFVCIVVMTAALWFIVSSYLVNSLLEREWQATAQLVRAGVKDYLTEEDFTTKDRKSVGHKFEALLRHLVRVPEIVRFKVYNDKGVVIWAEDKKLVGKSFADNQSIQSALQGRVVANSDALTRQENASAVEVYVPIYLDKPSELLGVFETHRRSESIRREVREAQGVVLAVTFGGGLLLYLCLFAIVRQAARKIDEQQENLLKVQAELVATQRLAAVGEMAAAVAHGIGNPLSSIRAAAQVALLDSQTVNGSEGSEKITKNLRGIMQQVDRVQKRMQGLLNFAKPMEPHPAAVEINALLRDVAETMRERFVAAEIVPRLELDANLPRAIVDANQLEQAVTGLISNALEATPKGGTVTLRTERQNGNGKGIQISVEDTGEGIPQESRARVFEPFFTTKAHGTGIGLPLAKKFVERNGGTISIFDGQHGGTRIDVVFPAAHSD
jgi:signal transduction histidine kinase